MSFSTNHKRPRDRVRRETGFLLCTILLVMIACALSITVTVLLAIDHALSFRTTLGFTLVPALILYGILYGLTRPDDHYIAREMRRKR